jgi:FMN-dependent NADH-azoreductase
MKLLYITASPRGEKSRTIGLSTLFLKALKEKHPDLVVENLDLFAANLPPVLGGAIDAKYAFIAGVPPGEEALKSWDEIARYANDFLNADMYLIASPMWNFTVPYRLKQYIDIIMQAGILFKFTPTGVEGLAKNKKMFVITSRGSDYGNQSPLSQFDFQEPYLRSIFGFSGITDISFIHAQPMDYSPEIGELSLEKARQEVKILAANC